MNNDLKLSYAAINETPKWKDWSISCYTWQIIYPYDLDTIEKSDEIDIYDFDPMMNYYYPLPDTRSYDEKDAKKLYGLPLTLLEIKENMEWIVALALTGGGMDFSWEICEAYMALGFYPPIHFCRLPDMAGCKEHKKNFYKVIDACLESIKIKKRNLDFMTKDLKNLKE